MITGDFVLEAINSINTRNSSEKLKQAPPIVIECIIAEVNVLHSDEGKAATLYEYIKAIQELKEQGKLKTEFDYKLRADKITLVNKEDSTVCVS